MRPRISRPAPGTRWTIRETARLLNIQDSVVRYQITKGKVAADGAGVDAVSAWDWYKTYEPHRDNQRRRVRGRTIPEMQAAPGNGHGAILQPASQYHLISPRRPVSQGTPQLDSREWIEKFMRDKERALSRVNPLTGQREMNSGTAEPYSRVFKPFMARFPLLPLDRVEGRQAIVEWIHGLRHQKTGRPLADGSKGAFIRKLSTFLHWLDMEYGIRGPSLSRTSIPTIPAGAGVVYADEAAQLLTTARDHSEYTLFLLLAQTGARIGEILSIRPECLRHLAGYGWIHTWDKSTSANATGYRPLCLPSESYEALVREFTVHGELVLPRYNRSGEKVVGIARLVHPLVAESGRQIRMDDPHTFRAIPYDDSYDVVKYRLRRRMEQVGIYEPGKLNHAFRRAYEAEFLRNGGDRLYMRLIMGHVSKSNMDELYLRDKVDDVAAIANKFAPRSFLQGRMELASASLPELDASEGER